LEKGPVLVVAACIVRGESVLLARRNQPSLAEAHLKWELPGGKVRFGETPQEALKREILEELGTKINVLRLLPHLQTNMYHRADGTLAHFVVLAFESVVERKAARPGLGEESIKQFKWIPRRDVATLPSLPGTARFVECLDRIDRASLDDAHLYVRLERRAEDKRNDYWEFQCVQDLWGEFSLLERHVSSKQRSTQSEVIADVSQERLWDRLTRRFRELAREGYVVSHSSTPLLQPPL